MAQEKKTKKSASPTGGKAKPRSLKAAKQNTKASKSVAAAKGGAAAQPPAKGQEDGSPGGLGAVMIRNEFYRDGYRTALKLALLEALVILGLVGVVFFVIHTHQPENRYFATTEDGRLIPMVPLQQPNLSTPALMSWSAQAATEIMTFGFNDYKRRMQEAHRFFTKKGWDSFSSALAKARLLQGVEENQQFVWAAPRGAPVLTWQGVVFGRYQWRVQLPLVVTFESGALRKTDRYLVELLIVRVPRLESPSGIGIEQWVQVLR